MCKEGFRHGLITLQKNTVDLALETMNNWKNYFKTQDAAQTENKKKREVKADEKVVKKKRVKFA